MKARIIGLSDVWMPLEDAIYTAIVNGFESVNVQGLGIKSVPISQGAGTYSQRATYARLEARKLAQRLQGEREKDFISNEKFEI